MIIYNAPYSPALNPIELMFGVWKARAERGLGPWDDDADLCALQVYLQRQPQRKHNGWCAIRKGWFGGRYSPMRISEHNLHAKQRSRIV